MTSNLERNVEYIASRWPDLVPLHHAVPPELPVEQWPSVLFDYVERASAETETPRALPAMLAVAVISAAVQRVLSVEVKPGYTEPPNVYVAVGLVPGTRKSQEFKRATRPLVRWEAKQKESAAQKKAEAESKLATHNQRVSELRKKAAKATDDDEAEALAQQVADLEAKAPAIPKPARLFTGDVTTEHLGTMMSEQREAMAVMNAEGGLFETMAGRYGNQIPNFDLYLSGHAGDSVRVDRGSREPVMLDDPRLTVGLAVQPDVLSSLSSKPGFRGRGLLGRFLYAVPETNLGDRAGDGPAMNPWVLDQYETAIDQLIDFAQTADPVTLTLSADASQTWQTLWTEIEAGMKSGERFEHMRDWAGKAPGAAARLAALFHAFRHGRELPMHEISAGDMQAAADTIRALADHATAVYDLMSADPLIDGARVVLRWIGRHGLTTFTARQCYQHHKSRFPRMADLEPVLAVLVERGYIREADQATGKPGRPSLAYEVNPGFWG